MLDYNAKHFRGFIDSVRKDPRNAGAFVDWLRDDESGYPSVTGKAVATEDILWLYARPPYRIGDKLTLPAIARERLRRHFHVKGVGPLQVELMDVPEPTWEMQWYCACHLRTLFNEEPYRASERIRGDLIFWDTGRHDFLGWSVGDRSDRPTFYEVPQGDVIRVYYGECRCGTQRAVVTPPIPTWMDTAWDDASMGPVLAAWVELELGKPHDAAVIRHATAGLGITEKQCVLHWFSTYRLRTIIRGRMILMERTDGTRGTASRLPLNGNVAAIVLDGVRIEPPFGKFEGTALLSTDSAPSESYQGYYEVEGMVRPVDVLPRRGNWINLPAGHFESPAGNFNEFLREFGIPARLVGSPSDANYASLAARTDTHRDPR